MAGKNMYLKRIPKDMFPGNCCCCNTSPVDGEQWYFFTSNKRTKYLDSAEADVCEECAKKIAQGEVTLI